MHIQIRAKTNDRLALSELTEFQGELKSLSDVNYGKLKCIIAEHGFISAIHVWNKEGVNYILDGHQRLRTVKKMVSEGYTCPPLPVVFVEADSFDEAKRHLLSMASQFGVVEGQGLYEFMTKADVSFDEMVANFSFPEIDIPKFEMEFFTEPPAAGQCGEDEIPEVAEPKAKLGDLYQLGEHRLLCGNSTDILQVERLMNGSKADMVFTDPPYGMNAVSKSGVLSKNYDRDILGDDNTNAATDAYRLVASLGIPKLVFWGANYFASALPDAPCWLVWDKNNGGSDQMDCELAWTNLKGVTRQFTQASEKTNRVHPTQKPVALAEWCFSRYEAGDVLDLFLGSGSTLIACEKTKRKCYGMELDPHYCDVIIARWEKFTGKSAVLVT